ncbi:MULTISPECIES: acetolactate decarboxylase [Paenibacillus]|uniref:Alpha-acetolactate decarboxylase n=1 Tax=Paenibacillus albilobatus TaxID=2716884 RepID=A0A919XPP3_9BACL|nr:MULTISPECIES: acetolactate decarboxylase [Paenibacillus]GIO34462.1 alpha-acetolactate decarboxylase [Paenibacillus albilobatus]
MKKKRIMITSTLVAAALSLSALTAFAAQDNSGNQTPQAPVATTTYKAQENKNTLFQYSTINALMKGQFDGEMTLGELNKHGDTGLGTFNGVDGELTQLDGKFYRYTYEGRMVEVDKKELTPFAVTTKFQVTKTARINPVKDMTALNEQLTKLIDHKNNFYAFKIHGTFKTLKTRSEEKQHKPYPTLPEVLANQSVFETENVTGTLIGFYTPNYAATLNVPGFHYHVISDDKTKGGHVLNISFDAATVQIDEIANLEVNLPQTHEFHDADLTTVDPEDVHKVETDQK